MEFQDLDNSPAAKMVQKAYDPTADDQNAFQSLFDALLEAHVTLECSFSDFVNRVKAEEPHWNQFSSTDTMHDRFMAFQSNLLRRKFEIEKRMQEETVHKTAGDDADKENILKLPAKTGNICEKEYTAAKVSKAFYQPQDYIEVSSNWSIPKITSTEVAQFMQYY